MPVCYYILLSLPRELLQRDRPNKTLFAFFIQNTSLKTQSQKITYYGTKVKSQADAPPCNGLFQFPPWHSGQWHWLLGRCQQAAQKLCRHTHTWCVHSGTFLRIEIVCCSSWSFNNAYHCTEVSRETIIRRLVTKFWNTRSVCRWQMLIERQNRWNYGRTDFKQCISCNNGMWLQKFSSFVREGCHVW